MPAPKDKNQLTPWLKQHGYQWVLKSPKGIIVTVSEAIKQIEGSEQQEQGDIDYNQIIIRGVYPSEAAFKTYHIWPVGHDDDTGVFESIMDSYTQREERDGIIRYTFADSIVLVQHDSALDTESEYKDQIQKLQASIINLSP